VNEVQRCSPAPSCERFDDGRVDDKAQPDIVLSAMLSDSEITARLLEHHGQENQAALVPR
jgi:hypothetical protein